MAFRNLSDAYRPPPIPRGYGGPHDGYGNEEFNHGYPPPFRHPGRFYNGSPPVPRGPHPDSRYKSAWGPEGDYLSVSQPETDPDWEDFQEFLNQLDGELYYWWRNTTAIDVEIYFSEMLTNWWKDADRRRIPRQLTDSPGQEASLRSDGVPSRRANEQQGHTPGWRRDDDWDEESSPLTLEVNRPRLGLASFADGGDQEPFHAREPVLEGTRAGPTPATVYVPPSSRAENSPVLHDNRVTAEKIKEMMGKPAPKTWQECMERNELVQQLLRHGVKADTVGEAQATQKILAGKTD